MRLRAIGLFVLITGSICVPAAAQWIDYKVPGIPRNPDGKPNLTAPAPKLPDGKPDLSGIWQANAGGYDLNIATDLKTADVQPWAAALYQQRSENLSKDHPGFRCLPEIGPAVSLGMYKIVQIPNVVAFLSEGGVFRQILTDGRPLPVDPNPTWQGYSVGHWEGDTLVVESAGFNDKTWLDFAGHPHTEQLRVTERFHRRDFGHLEIKLTFEDPKAYNKPWTIAVEADLTPDTELLEYVCNENERDVQHFVVTEEDRRKTRTSVVVPVEILSKYTGQYLMVDHDGKPLDRNGKPAEPGAKPDLLGILLSGDQLQLQLPGAAGKISLTAETQSRFSVAGQPVDFVTDARGVVTHLVVHAVEGDMKAIRTGDLP